jgi:hypothetical protein
VAPGNRNANSVVRHITSFSHPSPYASFTASYAVACVYAAAGPGGVASAGAPGYVYEIDLDAGDLAQLILVDPVGQIAANPPLGHHPLVTHHDGEQGLILGIASPSHLPDVLVTTPRRPGPPRADPAPAIAHPELRAVVFALRDAEVLVGGHIPEAFVSNRYDVY